MRTRHWVYASALLALSGCASRPAQRAATPAPAAAAAVAPVCIDFSFPIYFELNSGQLTAAARQVLNDAASRVRGCTVSRVDVVGLSDASGAASRNLAVSRTRATAVADALAAAGLPRPTFAVEAVGESGAVTPAGQPEPLRRRTEVVIRATPAPAASAPAAPARR